MAKIIILAILVVIITTHFLIIRSAKKNISSLGDTDFNLSVASYTPRIKPGTSKVQLLSIGAEANAVLLTIKRYNPQIQIIAEDQIVLEDANIYTAEDLVYELRYIGADAIVLN